VIFSNAYAKKPSPGAMAGRSCTGLRSKRNLRDGGRAASHEAEDGGDHEENDRDEENDFRDLNRESRDATESQHGRYQGDDAL
jgi:hypothetical protein